MMRHAMKCLALVSLTFLTQCNSEPQLDSLEHLRCSGDGLCFTSQTADLLAGGYRQGELEIEFDVLYQTSMLNELNGGSPYCTRTLLENRQRRSFSDNNNCPEDWYRPKKGIYGTERYKSYTKLAHDLQRDLEQKTVDTKLQQAWNELLFMVRELADEQHPEFNNDVEHIELPQKTLQSALIKADLPEKLFSLDSSMSSPLSSSTSGAGTVTPSYYILDPKYEFRQAVELWSQPAKSLLFFGWDTRKHHSGTRSFIYSRRYDSKDSWELIDIVRSGNHGAKPGKESMQLYAICKELPITRGWYAAGGECEGGWAIEHLCNDDSAYQIWHAYGNWNGGNHCLGKRRDHRPWCDKPW